MTGIDTMEINAAAVRNTKDVTTAANPWARLLDQNKVVLSPCGNRRYSDKMMPDGITRKSSSDNYSI